MPGFRRWSKSKFERNPESSFKLLAAVLVITLYLIIKEFQHPTVRIREASTFGSQIQHTQWNGTGKAQETRAKSVRDAMRYTFLKYRENAWGCDDILPVSGGNSSSRNGWGAFIVDSASTLALMGLWDELAHSIEHILAIDFAEVQDLVDPFETTIRYMGGLLSIVELYDVGLIPEHVLHEEARDLILEHAITLAEKLAPAYDTPTGMPWPRIDFETEQGEPDPSFDFHNDPDKREYDHPVIGPARTGSSILENRVLTRLTGNDVYARNSTLAWAPLVWSKWATPWAGMVDAPIDIMTGAPVGRSRQWDGGHDSYYEYLLKITLLAPPSDPHLEVYKKRFLLAAASLRKHLSSRSAPAPKHLMQHLFIGRQDDKQYKNQMGHLACFAPGTILLASKFYDQSQLRSFALALLDGCRHTYTSTPTKIGPETWSWVPKFGYDDPLFLPENERQRKEALESGFWSTESQYKGRPEYVESLFYAWRITGEQRYREWAWEAFAAMEKHCKAPFGYAQLGDVYDTGNSKWVDMQESYWAAETLKYLWLTFTDVDVASLDSWVFSTEGHPFRMIR
ncbi:glycoside hydrolase family 47 protein [Cucurbitaria berberidis CBS 394.84]|uniref:alpha-1,2-Mannosidase n=1 Tax=Cucurbitaria berberidis CBS 394.84 TaxID=1168544 RepID=A0A9P4GD62_9PLEO|nr:glycoside hydrolase family 47 protein [Cucurbitaria berberidis CBS 394.84]KAF1843329.1 glycoside hydrolase family 47 protein [Cucurbitaria berberidis CBS 394.84]